MIRYILNAIACIILTYTVGVYVDIAWKGRTFTEVILPTVMAMGVAYALSHLIRLTISSI